MVWLGCVAASQPATASCCFCSLPCPALRSLAAACIHAHAGTVPVYLMPAALALANHRRFDMNLLSLPSKEKGALGEAWSQAQAALEGPQGPPEAAARLAALRLRYKL